MFTKMIGAAGGALALALVPAPAMAQQDDAEAALAALADGFEAEPLTPEQEARLPLAREIVGRILPDGAMSEMMGSMFDGLLGPLAELGAEDSDGALANALGYSASELGMDGAAAEAALEIVDPAWRDRDRLAAEMTQAMMGDMMTRMEPLMRNVMAELYAVYFDETELADINTFFSTESGANYARQSYRMASDPRIMAAVFAEPDLLFGPVMESAAAMEAAMAEVPAARGLADLNEAEVARLSELTGLEREDIEYGMEYAATLDGDF